MTKLNLGWLGNVSFGREWGSAPPWRLRLITNFAGRGNGRQCRTAFVNVGPLYVQWLRESTAKNRKRRLYIPR